MTVFVSTFGKNFQVNLDATKYYKLHYYDTVGIFAYLNYRSTNLHIFLTIRSLNTFRIVALRHSFRKHFSQEKKIVHDTTTLLLEDQGQKNKCCIKHIHLKRDTYIKI